MKAQVMVLAHKLVRTHEFFGQIKYSELLSWAMRQAWAQAKNPIVAVAAEAVKTFSDSIATCFAWVANDTKVEVTVRGKRTDKVFVNLDARKVSFIGKSAQIATQIATQFNFSLV